MASNVMVERSNVKRTTYYGLVPVQVLLSSKRLAEIAFTH